MKQSDLFKEEAAIGTFKFCNYCFYKITLKNSYLTDLNISFSFNLKKSPYNILWIIVSEARLDSTRKISDTILEVRQEEGRF